MPSPKGPASDSPASETAPTHIAAYDPAIGPAVAAWNAMEESTRIFVVTAWHKKARALSAQHPQTRQLRLHALGHVLAENLVASGHPGVGKTMAHLTNSGPSRHESIHAVAEAATACMLGLAIGGHEFSEDRLAAELGRIDKNLYFDTAPDAE